MPIYRDVCEVGKHFAAKAVLTEVAPAIWLCDEHLKQRDAARDQWAAQTNTSPLDEDTRRLLGTWRLMRGSAA